MSTLHILASSLPFLVATLAMSQTVTVNFTDQESGKPPKGFSTALTGNGRAGNWIIVADERDTVRGNVLAQTDMDPTGYRFPVCVYDGLSCKDADISVMFCPVKGTKDQAAGIVWRYKDRDNYYIVRANALENNVVLYKVEHGKRSDLPLVGKGRTYGEKINVPSGKWGSLRIVAKGDMFETYLNGSKLFDVKDGTFSGPGKVGVWTKADSYTLFDDLTITVLK